MKILGFLFGSVIVAILSTIILAGLIIPIWLGLIFSGIVGSIYAAIFIAFEEFIKKRKQIKDGKIYEL